MHNLNKEYFYNLLKLFNNNLYKILKLLKLEK